MVVIGEKAEFLSLSTGEKIEKRSIDIQWDVEEAEKGEHPHFMIKEIREQKDTLHRTINQEPALMEQLLESYQRSVWRLLRRLWHCGEGRTCCILCVLRNRKEARERRIRIRIPELSSLPEARWPPRRYISKW